MDPLDLQSCKDFLALPRKKRRKREDYRKMCELVNKVWGDWLKDYIKRGCPVMEHPFFDGLFLHPRDKYKEDHLEWIRANLGLDSKIPSSKKDPELQAIIDRITEKWVEETR